MADCFRIRDFCVSSLHSSSARFARISAPIEDFRAFAFPIGINVASLPMGICLCQEDSDAPVIHLLSSNGQTSICAGTAAGRLPLDNGDSFYCEKITKRRHAATNRISMDVLEKEFGENPSLSARI